MAAVRRWAGQHAGVLGPEDVVISADVDEVLSRAALHHLRHCGLAGPVLAGALVMPLGNLDTAFRSDYPVAGRPHSYAEPTIYQVSTGVGGYLLKTKYGTVSGRCWSPARLTGAAA